MLNAVWLVAVIFIIVAGYSGSANADLSACLSRAVDKSLSWSSDNNVRLPKYSPDDLKKSEHLHDRRYIEATISLCEAANQPNDPAVRFALGRQYARLSRLSRDQRHAEQAKRHLEFAINGGSSEAYEEVGILYELSLFNDQDFLKTANDWYRSGAAAGAPYANALLGSMAAYGMGKGQNCREALEFFARAEALSKRTTDNGGVASIIGVSHRDGVCRQAPDRNLALLYLRQGASAHHARSMVNLAALLDEPGRAHDDAEIIGLLYRAAARGDTIAMRMIANRHRFGRGLPMDLRLAREWLEEAAERHDALAMRHLAELIPATSVASTDLDAVFATTETWRKRTRDTALNGARRGSPFDMYYLAHILWDGIGGDEDRGQAWEWMEKAAARNVPGAINGLGLFSERIGNHKAANVHYRRAMVYGDTVAIANLGLSYIYARGVPKDCERGIALLQQAVKAENAFGMFRLAQIITRRADQRPCGIKTSHGEVRPLLERSALLGNADAIRALADMAAPGIDETLTGSIERVDAASQFKWGERLARIGNMYGAHYLAELIEKKPELSPNGLADAFSWYSIAAAAGDTHSIWAHVAPMLAYGRGVTANPQAALAWLRRAAETDSMGQCQLGKALALPWPGIQRDDATAEQQIRRAIANGTIACGREVAAEIWKRKDSDSPARAIRILTLSADAGELDSMKDLAGLFVRGGGGPADPKAGEAWYSKAAHDFTFPDDALKLGQELAEHARQDSRFARPAATVLRIAIDRGEGDAAYDLARVLDEFLSDPQRAADWMLRALRSRVPAAIREVTTNADAWSENFRRHLRERLKADGFTGSTTGEFRRSGADSFVARTYGQVPGKK